MPSLKRIAPAGALPLMLLGALSAAPLAAAGGLPDSVEGPAVLPGRYTTAAAISRSPPARSSPAPCRAGCCAPAPTCT